MTGVESHSALVLIPAYNAARHLPELIPRLKQYACENNILFVNDGSTDDTLDLLKQHAVKYLSFQSNRGKGAALAAGFRYAIENGYRSVLTIDADLQHLPEEMLRFYALNDGNRLVIGTRRMELGAMPFARWLTNNLTSLIISVFSSQRVRDSQSGYRLIPTCFLKVTGFRTVHYDLESEMLFKAGAAGYLIDEVPIATIYEGSQSFINPLTDTGRFIRQIWKRIWM